MGGHIVGFISGIFIKIHYRVRPCGVPEGSALTQNDAPKAAMAINLPRPLMRVTARGLQATVKTFLPLMIMLLPGCGIVEVSTNPYTPQSVRPVDNGPPIVQPPLPAPPPPPPAPPPPPPPVNPTGIWDVKATVGGSSISEVALIAGGMYFSLAATDQFGCRDITGGDYTISGSTFTGSGVTGLLDYCAGPNGDGFLAWTLSGTLTGAELNLSFTDGSTLVPTLEATLDPLYNLYSSSLATLVGNWDHGGNVLTVNSDGTFFEQQGNGCTITGVFTIIDPAHNLYGVSFIFDSATCTNNIAGIQFTGLAYLTPNTSSGWYHLSVDASGVTASGAPVVVFDSITPYFAPPTG